MLSSGHGFLHTIRVFSSKQANGFLCIDFIKNDPSQDGKEIVVMLTNFFSKSSQDFVTTTKMALYIYSIPSQIDNDKGHIFKNETATQLYSMSSIQQLTTTLYNPYGNSQCELFNHILHNLLKTLPKE